MPARATKGAEEVETVALAPDSTASAGWGP